MTDAQKTGFIRISFLLLILAASQVAMAAPPVRVESATPSEAEQQTTGLEITIGGSGFDTAPGAVTSVRFLLPCEAEPCTDTGGVDVTTFTVPSKKKIIATIDVGEFAIVDFRDIEVQMTRGRGGKGTTLFSVRQKNTGGPQTTTCTEAYFPGRPGICTDMGGNDCVLGIGNPERIKLMTEDCKTKETIVLPNGGSLVSNANIESPADYKTLTAALGFTGTTVIANAGHRATVRALNITIENGVATGCGAGIESAIRFVLDGAGITELPDPDDPNRASLLYVNNVYLTTVAGAPLCEPIVMARKQAYTDDTGGATNDWRIYASGNHVPTGSYSRTGIRFEGFKQQEDINPPSVDANVIGAPDCMGAGDAVGISYGPLIARDFDPSSEALIESNTVNLSDEQGCTGTVGVLLFGDSDTDMEGKLNNNMVTGGDVGLVIDASSSTDSVNMKGNTLTGEGGDAAVCSDIPVDEKGKPNQINGAWGVEFDLVPPCDGS